MEFTKSKAQMSAREVHLFLLKANYMHVRPYFNTGAWFQNCNLPGVKDDSCRLLIVLCPGCGEGRVPVAVSGCLSQVLAFHSYTQCGPGASSGGKDPS